MFKHRRVLARILVGALCSFSGLGLGACGGGGAGGTDGGGGAPDTEAPEPPTPALTIPSSVEAEAAEDHLDVRWARVEGASTYGVYLAADPSVGPANYGELPEGRCLRGIAEASTRFEALEAGGTYWVVVTAVVSGEEGAPSATVSEILPVGQVAHVAAQSGRGTVELTWSAARGADGYEVYMETAPDLAARDASSLPLGDLLPAEQTSLRVDGLANGTTYWFSVRARNRHGPGPISAEALGHPSGLGFFDAVTEFEAGKGASSSALGDLDDDGDLDLVVANGDEGSVQVFHRPSEPRAPFLRVDTLFTPEDRPVAVALADADQDGRLDLYVALEAARLVAVHLADGYGSFLPEPYATVPVGAGPRDLLVRDLDEDGWPDVLTADAEGGTVSFAPGQDARPYWVEIHGMQPDYGWVDVIDASGQVVGQELQQIGEQILVDQVLVEPNAFGETVTVYEGDAPVSLLVDDLTGDGTPDLAVIERGSSRLALFRGDGAGHFSVWDQRHVGEAAVDVASADTDGDGDLDLIVTSGDDACVALLTNGGSGGFTLAETRHEPTHPVETATADFDQDGILDLVVADLAEGELRVALGIGGGQFVAHSEIRPGASIAHMEVGDFDDDGFADVLVTDPTGGAVFILYGARQ